MKRNKIVFVLVLLQVILFSSCLTTKQMNLLQEPRGGIPFYRKVQEIGEYRIKRGDELAVQVMIQNTSSTARTAELFNWFSTVNTESRLQTLTVSPAGIIYFPYLGDIYVVDRTTLEIQIELEARINRDIFAEEACVVNVQLANRYYSVIGEAGVGQFAILKEQLTIFQALAQSGNIRDFGDRSKVRIIRRESDGTTLIRTFDLRSSTVINSEFYYIQPNDIIYVQPLGRRFLGLSSFSSIFAIMTTVASLGFLIYNFTKQ